MNYKKDGFYQFQLTKNGKWLQIDHLIKEIDNLKVCNCAPKDNNS